MKRIFTLCILLSFLGEKGRGQAIVPGTTTGVPARPTNNPGNDTLLRITLYNTNLGPGVDSLVDGVLEEFAYNYCDCIDALDGFKAGGNLGESLSIDTDDTLLVIERRHIIIADDTIFLHLAGARGKTYRFGFDAAYLNGLATGFVADKFKGINTPLNLQGNTSLIFTVENVPGSYSPDRFMIVFSTLKVLPVTFRSVKAYRQDKNISVQWKVDNERNIKEYDVEKSTDGVHFTTLLLTRPANNSGGPADYTGVDITPATNYNYYRIRSVNIDGGVSFSTIVKVMAGKEKSGISIYPNPITAGHINLQFINEPAGKYEIRLLNNIGQLITQKQITHEDGSSTELIKWDFTQAHGMYQLEVTRPDGSVKHMNVLY